MDNLAFFALGLLLGALASLKIALALLDNLTREIRKLKGQLSCVRDLERMDVERL